MSTLFPIHTPATAPAASRPVLDALQQAFGVIPNLAGGMANSPVLIQGFLGLFQNVHAGTFSEAEIQVLLLTNAVTNRCEWAARSTRARVEGRAGAGRRRAIRAGGLPRRARMPRCRAWRAPDRATRSRRRRRGGALLRGRPRARAGAGGGGRRGGVDHHQLCCEHDPPAARRRVPGPRLGSLMSTQRMPPDASNPLGDLLRGGGVDAAGASCSWRSRWACRSATSASSRSAAASPAARWCSGSRRRWACRCATATRCCSRPDTPRCIPTPPGTPTRCAPSTAPSTACCASTSRIRRWCSTATGTCCAPTTRRRACSAASSTSPHARARATCCTWCSTRRACVRTSPTGRRSRADCSSASRARRWAACSTTACVACSPSCGPTRMSTRVGRRPTRAARAR